MLTKCAGQERRHYPGFLVPVQGKYPSEAEGDEAQETLVDGG